MSAVLKQILTRSDPFSGATYIPEKRKFKRDPLVLACSAKDLQDKLGDGWIQLEDSRVLENITDDTIRQAEDIRKYYTKKFFWKQFSDQLSDYRRRVCFLLENQITECEDKDCGIYAKLPWFYEEDMAYETIKQQVKTDRDTYYGKNSSQKIVLDFEYMQSTVAFQRKHKLERLWFKNEDKLYCIEVEANNILLDLFKNIVQRRNKITFETRIVADYIDSLWYFKLFNFTIKD